MVGISKSFVDELSVEAMACDYYVWLKKEVWACRVFLVLLVDFNID